MIGEATDEGN